MKPKKAMEAAVRDPPILILLLYGGGYIATVISNYMACQQAGGFAGDGTAR
jgi:hypothetical protein